MKCPVCKTECHEMRVCPECGFDDLAPVFLSEAEGKVWMETVVWPWRRAYWKTLKDFTIEENKLVKYTGKASKVTIPYGIQILGQKCMEFISSLQTVIIPSSVTIIEERAFDCCFDLQHIELPDTTHTIGVFAFGSCSKLTQITLPTSLKVISKWLLSGCYQMDELTIPEGVEIIEERSLPDSALKVIHIPESVREIGPRAITGYQLESITVDKNNPNFYVEQGCLIDSRSHSVIASIAHPGTPTKGAITKISDNAFEGRKMTEFIIPEGVTHIGADAFALCFEMERIHLPKTLESIGVGALKACHRLSAIDVHPENPYYFCENDCLIDRRNMEIITCFGIGKHFVLPMCAESIAPYAYHGCSCQDQVVIIGPKIKTIRNQAISSLNNVHILVPLNVSTMEACAIRISGRIFCEHIQKPDGWADNWTVTTGEHSWQVFSEVHWADSWHFEDGTPVANDNSPSLFYR